MLVDTPGVGPDVVRRLTSRSGPDALARATYGSGPGHPVLLGRDHWPGVLEVASGDRGARDYLRAHPVTLVECADIGTGDDVDTAEALRTWNQS
jgi:CTP:molybdopterin cytidylyltransferase MocA